MSSSRLSCPRQPDVALAACSLEKATDFANYVYVNTPMRATPFLVGLAVGYLLACELHRPLPAAADHPEKGKRRRRPLLLMLLGWLLSAAVCLTVVFALARTYHTDFQYDKTEAAFYAALHRCAWALGVAWVIYACSTGRGGGSYLVLKVKEGFESK